ncbi:hypothetical protein SLA2020_513820 [Shorea laevis]
MKQGLEVFDFSEGDEPPEHAAGEHIKLKNPDVGDSGSLKHEFLAAQSSAVSRTEINDVPCMDIDAIDCDHNGDEAAPSVQPNGGEEGGSKERESGLPFFLQSKSTSNELQADLDKDNNESRSSFPKLDSRDSCAEAPLPWRNQLNSALLNLGSSYESVDVDSEGNESMGESIPSSPSSNVAEDHVLLNGNIAEGCIGNVVLDNINKTVDIIPDYVFYRDNYYTGSLVLFSPGGIKIEGPPAFDNGETFSFEREIDDIVEIACQWSQRMGYIVIKLQVLSKDDVEGEILSGASGIEEVKFSSLEPNWPEKQQAIASLNVKFMAIWDFVLDQVAGVNEHDVHRPYFPNFDEPFEEVIYPKGDSDAVSISKRDVDLLQPETFVNDTIIDFYIKYLKNQIPPQDRQRFHFFNSFFFRKLADLDKDPSSISDGRAAFLRVHKWTRKVDIFGKDYIFIPVNFNLHWSLIVICHPGEVARIQGKYIEKSPKVPCILHMDSIRGSHAGLKNLVQSYLWEEWKGRLKETCEDLSSRFLNLRFVSLELPQQENSFDCGLFLLHYLELFLAKAPTNFSPFKIAKFSDFLNVDWFPPTEASLKRTLIQKLVFELLETHHEEIASAECNDEQHSRFPEKNRTGLEFLSDRCTLEIACNGNLPNSQAGQGIEMTLLETSSTRNLHCSSDSGMVLREFFEPGVASRALLGQFQSFDQPSSYYHLNGAISPGEQEDVEGDAEFVYLDSGENNFQQLTGTTAQACEVPYSSRGLMMDTSWNLGNSIQGKHDIDTSTETSQASEDDDDDVGIIEPGEKMQLNEKDHMDQRRSPSVENVECDMEGLASATDEMVETGGTEASEDADRRQHGNEKKGNVLPSEENPTVLLQQEPFMAVNQLGPDSEMAVLTSCRTEASEDADVMQNGNEEDKDLPSSEENPTVLLQQDHSMTVNQLDQDSDLVENKEAMCDLQIIRDGLLAKPDEQKPPRRIRVSSPHEGEVESQNRDMTGNQLDQGPGMLEHKEAMCDSRRIGDGLLAEPDEEKPTKRIGVSSPHEGEVDSQNPDMTGNQLDQGPVMLEHKEAMCDSQIIGDGLLAEPDDQKPTQRIGVSSPHEGEVDSQNPDMTGNQLDQGPVMLEHKEAMCDSQIIGDGLLAEPDDRKPTQRIQVSSPHEGEVDSQKPDMRGNQLDQGPVMLEHKEAMCDSQIIGDELLAEPDDQKPTKRIGVSSPHEGDVDSQNPDMTGNQSDQGPGMLEHKEAMCDSRIIGDGLLAEPDEQKPTKRIRVSSPHEGEVDSQNPSMTGNQLDQGPVVLEHKEAYCNDMQMVEDGLLPNPDEQQPAKKIRLMSPDESKVDSHEP